MREKYQAIGLDDDSIVLTTEGNARILRGQGLLTGFALLYEFEADTPEEAHAIHNLRQGWEPYKPEGEPEKCPKCNAIYYPESSGICWRCGRIE
jgi:hypothetical protein